MSQINCITSSIRVTPSNGQSNDNLLGVDMGDTQTRKRIFHRFCKWYHQGENSKVEGLDVPDIVVLLQAAGFSLNSFKFESGQTSGGCKVVLECGVSGVRAELTAPPEDKCRCNRFSKKPIEPHQLKEQASLWQVTTSQESLHMSSLGSSILPDLEPARLGVMREVLLLLQEEMALQPRSSERSSRRLSTGSLNSVNNSFESLQVRLDDANRDAALVAAKFERRASISCCDDLKKADLPPSDPFFSPGPSHMTWGAVSSTSLPNTSSSDANSNFSIKEGKNLSVAKSCLKNVMTYASKALRALEPEKVTSKPPLVRKTTFSVVKPTEAGLPDMTRKKAKIEPTPIPPRRIDSLTRSSRAIPKSPAPAVPKTPTVPIHSKTPTVSVLPKAPAVMATPKTDPVRRRTVGVTRSETVHRPLTRAAAELAMEKAGSSSHHEPNVFKRLSISKKKPPPTPDGKK